MKAKYPRYVYSLSSERVFKQFSKKSAAIMTRGALGKDGGSQLPLGERFEGFNDEDCVPFPNFIPFIEWFTERQHQRLMKKIRAEDAARDDRPAGFDSWGNPRQTRAELLRCAKKH